MKMQNSKIYVRINLKNGKKKPFFGTKWGTLREDQANATAIKTGDGLVVVDIDTKNLEEIDHDLVKLLPEIPTVETARGYHYYFNVKSNFKSVSGITEHVDIKGTGGLVFNSYWGTEPGISYAPKGKTHEMSSELEEKLRSYRLLGGHYTQKTLVPVTQDKASRERVEELLSYINPDENYDKWLRVGMALKDWDDNDGFYIFDSWSGGGGSYKEGEILSKWDSFKGSGVTLGTVYEYAREGGYIQSASNVGFGPIEVIDVIPKIWYNVHTEKYCYRDEDTGDIIKTSKQGFTQVLKSNGVSRPSDVFNTIKTLKMDYIPTSGGMINPSTINIFRPTELMDIQKESGLIVGIPPVIDKVLDNVFVSNDLKMGFLNWLSFIYQNRRKTGVVWILKGAQGSGKGIITEKVMGGIFGHNMIPNLTDSNMESQFNSLLEGRMIVHFNEISAEDRRSRISVKNKLKTWITDDTLTINSKGIKEYVVKNHINIIINTNEMIPIDIDDGDRRFSVVETGGALKELDWFDGNTTIGIIEKELKSFAKYLRHFNVDENMARTAIDNDHKREIVSATKTTAQEIAEALISGDFEYFAFTGWDGVELPFYFTEDELEAEFNSGEISNQSMTILISSAYGKRISPATFQKTIISKYSIGAKIIKKINGKTTRVIRLKRFKNVPVF